MTNQGTHTKDTLSLPRLNIVIPVFNEEASLQKLYDEIAAAVEVLGVDWYITFVDDGSSDESLSVLRTIAKTKNHIRILALSRNFGKEIALSAGLDNSDADVVLMMDSDLQHPPEYIAEFLERWKSGAQVVVGVRSEEGTENWIKIFGSKLFYVLINKVSQIKIVPRATDFRLLDKEVVDAFRTMPEHNRITRGMIDWLGYKRSYVSFAAARRHAGEATYDTRKLFKLAFDSFVSMTMLPLRISVYLGVSTLAVFGPLGMFMLVSKYMLDDRFDFSGPATLAVLIVLLVGVILVNIGFVGLYIANIQDQVRGRPLYVINKKFSGGNFSARNKHTSSAVAHADQLDPVYVAPAKGAHQNAAPYVEKDESEANRAVSVAEIALKNRYPQAVHRANRTHRTSKQHVDRVTHVVWLSWKDMRHPAAGGAELVQHELCKRLAADGYRVTVITSRPKGAQAKEVIAGYEVDRKGGLYSVYWHAWRSYRKTYRDIADITVEEVNTVGFFSRWYISNNTRSIVLFHQLAREIWFYEYFPPLNFIGYLIEPLSLRFITARSTYGDRVVTVSNSTRLDLVKNSVNPADISIISEGISLTPIVDPGAVSKYPVPSILAYGSIRGMKRTTHILKAYEIAKKSVPDLVLTIAGGGSGDYAKKVHLAVRTSPYADDITIAGRVAEEDKAELLGRHHFLISAAVKEGWGITITEAASQGTPAIAYNVDGQRDAVFGGAAGILVHPEIEQLARAIVTAFEPSFDYQKLQRDAWLHAQAITFDNSYEDFLETIYTPITK